MGINDDEEPRLKVCFEIEQDVKTTKRTLVSTKTITEQEEEEAINVARTTQAMTVTEETKYSETNGTAFKESSYTHSGSSQKQAASSASL